MKPREHVETNYEVDANGVVRSPGKFEGEPWWVVTLWDWALEGAADEELDGEYVFDISWSEVNKGGELEGLPDDLVGKRVCLRETEQGFVNCCVEG